MATHHPDTSGAVTGKEFDLDTALEPSRGARLRRRIFGHVGFLLGTTIIVTMLLVAFTAPLLAPYDPYETTLSNRLQTPFWHATTQPEHLLGTDRVGRDYLSRLIYGSQISDRKSVV